MTLKRNDTVYFKISSGIRQGGSGSGKVLSVNKDGVRVKLVDASVPYRPHDDIVTLDRADISAASI